MKHGKNLDVNITITLKYVFWNAPHLPLYMLCIKQYTSVISH